MKVGKEEIVGALVAVESYLKRDHAKDWSNWTKMAQRIAKSIRKRCGVKTSVGIPTGNYKIHHCIVEWEKEEWGLTTTELERLLKDGKPSIIVHSKHNPSLVRARVLIDEAERRFANSTVQSGEWIAICPFMLSSTHEKIVTKRVSEVFCQISRK
jgi:L-seryl-tRNA(Ser) seleniumtransferase